MKQGFRKLVSVFLVLAITVGLCPISVLPVTAAPSVNDPAYTRAAPEAAILNAYTGTDAKFYEKLKTNYGKEAFAEYYNATTLFLLDNGEALKYTSRVYDNAKLNFDGYGDSVLRSLTTKDGNLSANLSATLYNRVHTHKAGFLSLGKQDVLAYETVRLYIAGNYCGNLFGTANGNGMKVEYPRLGDYTNTNDSYSGIYWTKYDHGKNAYLEFSKSSVSYNNGKDTCTCGGAYAENMVVSFRDTKAPALSNIFYSTDGGNKWVRSYNQGYIGKGGKLLIKLVFDEPIRFADDSASGKGSLFLSLRSDGSTDGGEAETDDPNPRAYLTKLDGNELWFEYDVKDDIGLKDITTVSYKYLNKSGVELKQVYKDKSFSLSGGNGFSTADSYITDLAGNPFSGSSNSFRMRIDTNAPKIAKIDSITEVNNSDVKEALGSTKLDASDTYLGVGDTITFNLIFDEMLNLADEYALYSFTNALITTNLRVDGDVISTLNGKTYKGLGKNDDGYLTVRSSYLFHDDPTVIRSGTVPISSNLSLDPGETGIKVTYVEITDVMHYRGYPIDVTDLSGNIYVPYTLDSENTNLKKLDVSAPVITGGGETVYDSNDPLYDTGFRYTVNITDTDGSGTDGLYGYFTLENGGDKLGYSFEYAVSADAGAALEWKKSSFGEKNQFTQVSTGNYIYIRPIAAEKYADVSNCTLTIVGYDYAGNMSTVKLPPSSSLGFYIDKTAPTVRAGSVSRSLDGNMATLEVKVFLSDLHGIGSWKYAFTDSDTVAPDKSEFGNGELNDTASAEVCVIAKASIKNGERFDKYLWVSATDNSDAANVMDPICLGGYTYDLTEADYSLDITGAIMSAFDTKIERMEDGDKLVFLIKCPSGDAYAELDVDYAEFENCKDKSLINYVNDYASGNGWHYVKVSGSDTEGYTFSSTEGGSNYSDFKKMNGIFYTEDGKFWESLKSGEYSGELELTVFAGRESAFETLDNYSRKYNVIKVGTSTDWFSSERYLLRIAGNTENYGTITLEGEDSLFAVSNGWPWLTANETIPATLGQKVLTLTFGEDKNGWNYEDIDVHGSYIEIVNTTENETYKVPIAPVTASTASQPITLPNKDYKTGVYKITAHIECRAGINYDIRLKHNGKTSDVLVDATVPDSEFSIGSIIVDPDPNDRNVYNIGDYGEISLDVNSSVIYLPMYDLYESTDYKLTVSSNTDTSNVTHVGDGYAGQFVVVVKNTDPALEKHTLEMATYEFDQSEISNEDYGSKYLQFIDDADSLPSDDSKNMLYLYKGRENYITVQKIYSNGGKSDIKHYTLFPDDDFITGSAEITDDKFIFTPESDANLIGAEVYMSLYDHASSKYTRYEMTERADGTYACDTVEGGGGYMAVTVNAHGSAASPAYVIERSPWFEEGVLVVNPDEELGGYNLNFHICDDLGDIEKYGIKFKLEFDDEYSKLLGTDSLNLEFAPGETYITYEIDNGDPTTGVYYVYMRRSNEESSNSAFDSFDYLSVGMYGYTAYVDEVTSRDITFKVTATDRFGKSASVSKTLTDVPASAPEPIMSGNSAPKFEDGSLTINFTKAIRPADSWAWNNAANEYSVIRKYYNTEWEDAFPIAVNGEHEISYTDIFGNLYTRTIDLGDIFVVDGVDYSIDLEFSETEPTAEAIYIRTDAINGTGGIVLWEHEGATVTTMDPTSGESSRYATTKRETKLEHNAEIFVTLYENEHYITDYNYAKRSFDIYVTNIINGAPEADVRYYLDSAGREFSQTELEQYVADYGENGTLESLGGVRAWYRASRNVTPIEGNTEIYYFTADGERSYTFEYVDDFGNRGSATAVLPSGLIITDPPAPPAPKPLSVSFDIYLKRSGNYSRVLSLMAADAPFTDDVFDGLGITQAYTIKVKAAGENSVDITLEGVSDESAVKLSGMNVEVTKPTDFTVKVKNATDTVSVDFKAAMFESIDMIAPGYESEIVYGGLYTKIGYFRLFDRDAAGNESAGMVNLDYPSNIPTELRDGRVWYKVVFTDNGSFDFGFSDEAGNKAVGKLVVDGINTEPPKLEVTWSPSYVYEDESGRHYDPKHPTTTTVNTNVYAHITGDVPFDSALVKIGGLWHDIKEENGYRFYSGSVSFSPNMITVCYEYTYYGEIELIIGGANGKTTSLVLPAMTVIDKIEPYVVVDTTPMFKKGAAAPYAYEVRLTPSEPVRFANMGNNRVYSEKEPLVMTCTKGGDYRIIATDLAGNRYTVEFTLTPPDLTAPVITLDPEDTSSLKLTNGEVRISATVNEDCTLTCNGNTYTLASNETKELVFAENGTFIISARDGSGNVSEKFVTIGNIDRTLPQITFDTTTVQLMQNSAESALRALLDDGYNVWDNLSIAPDVVYDITNVELDKPGLYYTVYTVTDAAGNTVEAKRYVRVISKDLPCIEIDGKVVTDGATLVCRVGTRTVKVQNLKEIIPGVSEPYKLRLERGILSRGQMKYISDDSLKVENGSVTFENKGFYTLSVITQSRAVLRILVYVEN